jgi:hypothetical protein
MRGVALMQTERGLGGLYGVTGANEVEMATSERAASVRFPISFDGWYRVLSTALGLPPSKSYVSVDHEQVEVRMGWAFLSRFPRSAVESSSELDISPLSRGVHGFGGRWLVNGSGRGIVRIELSPRQRAYVIGFPVRLQSLLVSVAQPSALASAVGGHEGNRLS